MFDNDEYTQPLDKMISYSKRAVQTAISLVRRVMNIDKKKMEKHRQVSQTNNKLNTRRKEQLEKNLEKRRPSLEAVKSRAITQAHSLNQDKGVLALEVRGR